MYLTCHVDRIILVLPLFLTDYFDVEEAVRVFAEDHREIRIAWGHGRRPLEMEAFGEPWNKLGAF